MALTCSSKNSVNKFLKPNCDQDLLQTERFCFQWDIPCLKNFIRIHQQLLELLAKIHKIDPILFLKFYKKNSVSTLWSRSPPKTNQDLSIVDIKQKCLHTCEYTCVHIAVKKNCHKIFTRICTFITVHFLQHAGYIHSKITMSGWFDTEWVFAMLFDQHQQTWAQYLNSILSHT